MTYRLLAIVLPPLLLRWGRTRVEGLECVPRSGPLLARCPRRPRVTISFFEPSGGQPGLDEEPQALSTRLLGEVRAIAPPSRRAAAWPTRKIASR